LSRRTSNSGNALALSLPAPAGAGVRVTLLARTAALGLALGFVAALFLRLWHLDQLGFNSDETVYGGQGASIANDALLTPYFPIFRAHPLLFQTIVSIPFALGGGDVWGRLLAAVAGLATIFLTYRTAFSLYGRRAGVVAAVLIALMPYHVLVSRQLLLDGPMAFFFALCVLFLALYVRSPARAPLFAAAFSPPANLPS